MSNYQLFLLFILLLVGWARAYKHGAPLSVCDIMMPSPLDKHGHGASPKHSNPPYHIEVTNAVNQPIVEYTPGSKEALRIVISGERFRGFLLQARSLLGAGRRIGGFVEPLPAGSKFLECDGNDVPHTAITHDCGHAKQDLKFLWPTPRYDVGPVQFIATVVFNKSDFWTNVQSIPIYPKESGRSSNIVNTSKCGRGFGCFRFGAKGCHLDDSCNYTLAWKCLRHRTLFELTAVTNNNTIHIQEQGTYFGVAMSNDDRMGDDELFTCQMFRNRTRVDSYYNYTPKSDLVAQMGMDTDLIKIHVDNKHFYCRLTRRWLVKQSKYYFFVWGKVREDGSLESPSDETAMQIGSRPLNLCYHSDYIATAAAVNNDALSPYSSQIFVLTLPSLLYFLTLWFC